MALNPAIASEDKVLGTWGDAITLTRKPSGVAYLAIDVKGLSNTLSSHVLDCFTASFKKINEEKDLKGILLHSPKDGIFITGADIKEIVKFEDQAAARSLSSRGHKFLTSVIDTPLPVVAAVDGACLGGGLELVLCLDKILAADTASTIFGLPEVTIGLIPGLGGTQRLPRRVGYRKAVDMILSGSTLKPAEALEVGLIDRVVVAEDLLAEAEKTVLALFEKDFDSKKYRVIEEAKVEEAEGGAKKRAMVLKSSKRAVRMRASDNYPAPALAIEVMETGFNEGLEAGLAAEIEAFSKVAVSDTARNMINFYFHKEMASQMAIRAASKFGTPETVAIIGSGFMGRGIAELCLENGLKVLIRASSEEKSEQELERLKKRFPELTEEKLISVTDLKQLREADLVIESIYENLEAKQKLIEEIWPHLGEKTILASNTSSIPVERLANFAGDPTRFIGLHFFSPINLMPLVEAIVPEKADKTALNRGLAFVSKLGKVPVSVADSPGFIVNRLLTCYLTEALHILVAGTPVQWIDTAARQYGMPFGPLELLDDLGWGLSQAVSECVSDAFGERIKLPKEIYFPIDAGFDGKSNNKGIYVWESNGKKAGVNAYVQESMGAVSSDEEPTPEEITKIQAALFLPMIDEASRILEDKVVKKPRDIDLALIIGAGYPPFRGGLLRSADKMGIDHVIEGLERIYSDKNQRREISNLLREMHNIGRKFYSLS